MPAPRSDTLIAADVVRALGDNPHTSEVLVQVQHGGEVTLRGNVLSADFRQEAERTAAAVSGVRVVHNALHVDNQAGAAGAPGNAVRNSQSEWSDARTGDLDLDDNG